ncbi:MAG: hypothetical protein PHT48_06315 [Dechloromonas sp.]|nr:hypothetical protein [Dechloromonas sp.]
MPPAPRLILLHKQKSSGRLRFLCFADGILAFSPLPAMAALRDEDYSPTVHIHPTALVREAETRLGLPEAAIEALVDFAAWVDTPAGDIPVLLAAFTDIDPPFVVAERQQARFIALTEARSLSDVERNLLRRAYEHVLG